MQTSFLAFLGPIGGSEMIMIFVVILLLFGAKKLPELARGVGKSMGEFKKAREEFEYEITRSEEEVTSEDSAKKKKKASPEVKARPAKKQETEAEETEETEKV